MDPEDAAIRRDSAAVCGARSIDMGHRYFAVVISEYNEDCRVRASSDDLAALTAWIEERGQAANEVMILMRHHKVKLRAEAVDDPPGALAAIPDASGKRPDWK